MQVEVLLAGILVNAGISTLFLVLAIGEIKRIIYSFDKWQKIGRICILGVILGSLTVNLSILLLYLQMAGLQTNLNTSGTIWPIVALAGYNIVLVSMSFLVWREGLGFDKKGIPLVLLQIALLLYSVIFANDFLVIWHDGPVTLIYTSHADWIMLLVGMTVGSIILYNSYIRRIVELSVPDSLDTDGSRAYFILALAFFAQFLIPRAIEGSVLDPFSVKFLALIVLCWFAYSLNQYSMTLDKGLPGVPEYDSENLEGQSIGPSMPLLAFGTAVATFFVLASRLQPTITQSWRDYLISQSLYLGIFLDSNLYLNLISVVFPFAIWCAIITIHYLLNRFGLTRPRNETFVWLLLSAVIGISLFMLINTGYTTNSEIEELAVYRVVAPFIIAPVISSFIIAKVLSRGSSENHVFSSSTRILLLYGTVLASAIISDFIIAFMPGATHSGNVIIGGAGFFDGLFWAPILAVVISEIFDSLTEIL